MSDRKGALTITVFLPTNEKKVYKEREDFIANIIYSKEHKYVTIIFDNKDCLVYSGMPFVAIHEQYD